mmetsp:Transcript_143306/g.250143  ORF Transcript_143306/g.250143 Transcript_143306/m.250143 type:complete len:550 (-) Transcript_143306:1-1650(-)
MWHLKISCLVPFLLGLLLVGGASGMGESQGTCTPLPILSDGSNSSDPAHLSQGTLVPMNANQLLCTTFTPPAGGLKLMGLKAGGWILSTGKANFALYTAARELVTSTGISPVANGSNTFDVVAVNDTTTLNQTHYLCIHTITPVSLPLSGPKGSYSYTWLPASSQLPTALTFAGETSGQLPLFVVGRPNVCKQISEAGTLRPYGVEERGPITVAVVIVLGALMVTSIVWRCSTLHFQSRRQRLQLAKGQTDDDHQGRADIVNDVRGTAMPAFVVQTLNALPGERGWLKIGGYSGDSDLPAEHRESMSKSTVQVIKPEMEMMDMAVPQRASVTQAAPSTMSRPSSGLSERRSSGQHRRVGWVNLNHTILKSVDIPTDPDEDDDDDNGYQEPWPAPTGTQAPYNDVTMAYGQPIVSEPLTSHFSFNSGWNQDLRPQNLKYEAPAGHQHTHLHIHGHRAQQLVPGAMVQPTQSAANLPNPAGTNLRITGDGVYEPIHLRWSNKSGQGDADSPNLGPRVSRSNFCVASPNPNSSLSPPPAGELPGSHPHQARR